MSANTHDGISQRSSSETLRIVSKWNHNANNRSAGELFQIPQPSRRRHIHPQPQSFGATPIALRLSSSSTTSTSTTTPPFPRASATATSRSATLRPGSKQKTSPFLLARTAPSSPRSRLGQKVVSPPNMSIDTSNIAGIEIENWKIVTSQGPIGDSEWFDSVTAALEPLSQPRPLPVLDPDTQSTRRQLALPEMVFPNAFAQLQFTPTVSSRAEETARDSTPFTPTSLVLSWNPMDCLAEWAEAHQYIPMPQTIANNGNEGHTTEAETNPPGYRGVSVLKSSDASLWRKKRQRQNNASTSTTSAPLVSSTTFHYDWTFSSPYWGTLLLAPRYDSCATATNDTMAWERLETSAMPMQMLTDRTLPILYFDSINLLEDDLHDNGLMQCTIKVRVMPTCAYILSQLFVRVDHVLVRLKETRLLVDWTYKNDQTPKRSGRLIRDIAWKEIAWSLIPSAHQDIKAWTTPEEQPQQHSSPEAAAAFHQRLQGLPQIPLPDDMPSHSVYYY